MDAQNLNVIPVSEVKLDFCEVWLGDDGILRTLYYPHTEIDIIMAKEITSAVIEICDGKSRPTFSDARNIVNISREARKYFAMGENARWHIAVATLTAPITKVLGGLFVKLNKPQYPLRFFTTEVEAIEWLNKFPGPESYDDRQ